MNKRTLRDEFAMAALNGDWASFAGILAEDSESTMKARARIYYRMADAMCQVRHEGAKKGRRRLFPFRRKDDPTP